MRSPQQPAKIFVCIFLLFCSLQSFSQDAGVSALLSPVDSHCGSSAGVVEVIVYNYGTTTLSNIPVVAKITGSSTFSLLDTLKKTISAGKQDTLSFRTTINTSTGGTFTFKCYPLLTGDKNRANDTLVQRLSLSAFPATPSPTGASRCGAGLLKYKAVSTTPGSTTLWYLTGTSATPFAKGDSISRNVSATTTYYAASVSGSAFDSLTTTFSGGATHLGNMFDVKALRSFTVDSFEVNFAVKGGDTLQFYAKAGSYAGFEAKPAAWTLIGKAFCIPKSGGAGPATFVFNAKGLSLSAGNRYAFYIRAVNKKAAIEMGTTWDSSYNKDLIIDSSIALAGSFGAVVTSRQWNGTVYYSTSTCTSPTVAVTGTVNSVVKSLALSKDKTSAGIFNTGTVKNPDQICVGDSLKYDLSTPSNFLNSEYGTKWSLTYAMKTAGGTSTTNYVTKAPSASNNGQFSFVPKTADADSVYILTITAINTGTGCDTFIIRYIHVNQKAVASFAYNNGCLGQLLSVTNTSTPTTGLTYTWYFGDGDSSLLQSPSYKYRAAGTYTVSLVASNGTCASTYSKAVTEYIAPFGAAFIKSSPFDGAFNTGDVNTPDDICATDTNTYQITSPKGLSNADFGTKWTITKFSFKTAFGYNGTDTLFKKPTSSKNGSFMFFPSKKVADSIFILTLDIRTIPGNCDSIMTRYIHVRNKAISKFGSINACLGSPVSIIDSSTVASPDKVSQWSWNFGDGQTSTAQNPKHSYANAGTYTVKLSATTQFNCGIATTRQVQQYPKPKALFTDIPGCNGTSSIFHDSSSIATGTITSWKWSFGDGGSGTGKTLTHTYLKSGYYNAKLAVVSALGCKDSITTKIRVLPKPVPQFSYKEVCVGVPMDFGNTSGDSVLGSAYNWDFGDGATATAPTPIHTFEANGTYKVVLKVISKNGCFDTLSQMVVPSHAPDVNFFAIGGCPGQPILFSDSSNSGNGSSYVWDFGDGSKGTVTKSTTTHTYKGNGTYMVKLVLTNPGTCVDSESKNVFITDVPKAGFSTADVCLGTKAIFTNSSTASGSLTYKWYFGDNSQIITTQNSSHNYSKPGVYTVKLAAINGGGCTDTFTQKLTVNPVPGAKWTYTLSKYTISFMPLDSTELFYKWYFGTATNDSSSLKKPSFTYPSVITKYDVKLRVTNGFGCEALVADSVSTDPGSGIAGTGSAGEGIRINVFPNPFENTTQISYVLPKQSQVKISVYDMEGKELARLKEGMMGSGSYSEVFEAQRYKLVEGIYFLKMNVDGDFYTAKIVVMK